VTLTGPFSSQNDRLWWTLKSYRRENRNRQEKDCSCRLVVTACALWMSA